MLVMGAYPLFQADSAVIPLLIRLPAVLFRLPSVKSCLSFVQVLSPSLPLGLRAVQSAFSQLLTVINACKTGIEKLGERSHQLSRYPSLLAVEYYRGCFLPSILFHLSDHLLFVNIYLRLLQVKPKVARVGGIDKYLLWEVSAVMDVEMGN